MIDHARSVANVAKELGVSCESAHRWIACYRSQGEAGLLDRSSRPRSPCRTPVKLEQRILKLRRTQRREQDWLGPEVGLEPRAVRRSCAAPRSHTCVSATR